MLGGALMAFVLEDFFVLCYRKKESIWEIEFFNVVVQQ